MSNTPDQFTFKELIANLNSFSQYVMRQWRFMVLGTTLFTIFLLGYNYLGDKTFSANTTFVLQNSAAGMEEISSLASLAGVSLGGLEDSDLFQIDNVQELYRSTRMIVKTLLSEAEFPEGKMLLVERYIDNLDYRDEWEGTPAENIIFDPASFGHNRLQDSLLLEFVEEIRDDLLSVSQPSRKLSILDVSVADEDPYLAKAFNEELVKNVNTFYKRTKTQKSGDNLDILQKQADSVKFVLDAAMLQLAKVQESAPNRNPLYRTELVQEQKLMVDISASSAIYEVIVTNLEMAKVSHRNKTPLIQIIDYPILPLPDDRWKLANTLLAGVLIGGVLSLLFLSLRRFYQLAMEDA